MRILIPSSAGAVFLQLLLAGPTAAQPVVPPDFEIRSIASGLGSPVALAFTPDGRILITEKSTGRIRVVRNDTLLAQPFADVPVNSCGERGALGIAVRPEFESNGWVYLFYTRSSTGFDTAIQDSVVDNRIVRFTASGDTALGGGETLLRSFPIAKFCAHQAGNLHFGPDDTLFVTMGDGNAGMELPLNLSDHRGKMLRLDPSTGEAAPGNFFAADGDTNTLDAVWAYGFRNSFDFAFHPRTGSMFATENGTDNNDEINLVVERGNYGWPRVEGLADTPDEQTYVAGEPTYRDPIWATGDSVVCPTGIAVKDSALWDGRFGASLFVGWCNPIDGSRRLVRHPLAGAESDSLAAPEAVFATGFGLVTDVEIDAAGDLWVLTFPTLWRIRYVPPVGVGEGPERGLGLRIVGPHPARGTVRLRARLAASAPARLAIHDVSGRRIRILQWAGGGDGEMDALWDGRDGEGRRVSPGVYFARLRQAERTLTRSIVWLE